MALLEKVTDHNMLRTLESLEIMVDAQLSLEGNTLYVIESIDKTKAVLAYIKLRINKADPSLIPLSVLNTLDDTLQQVTHSLSAFRDSNNEGHLGQALQQLDSCIIQVASIPLQTSAGLDDMNKTATSFRSSVANLFLALKGDADGLSKMQFDLQQKITEASSEITNQKQRLDTAITAFQQQFSDSQQTRQNEFASSEQNRLTAAQSSEESRQGTFETIKQQQTEDFGIFKSQALTTHNELVESLKDAAKSALGIIETQKTHAEKLVGIITNTGMAYGFQKTANEERKQAYIWSIVAVVAMSVWIITGCVFFGFTYDKELTLPSVIRQFLISTPFVLLSGFAAMRVAQHQKNERAMRKSELEIASIDPFLATLSDEDRNEVKREFATRYFGHKDVQEKQEPVPSNLVELAGSLVKVVQDLTKK